MTGQTSFDRLAAARPAILDRTELVVDVAEEHQILQHILESAVPSGAGKAAVTTLPAGSSRRRPVRLASITAGAAAVAVTAGVVAGYVTFRDGGSAGSRPTGKVPTIKTLAYRTAAATSQAAQNDVLYSQTVYPGGFVGPVGSIAEWDYGLSTREKVLNAQGGPIDDSSAVVSNGQLVGTDVDYTARTWSQGSIPLTQVGERGPAFAAQLAQQLLGWQDPSEHTVVTRVTVDGRPMFQVTQQQPAQPRSPLGMPFGPLFASPSYVPSLTYNGAFSLTVWIDAATYLPVRVVYTTVPGGQVIFAESLQWLTPSAANLTQVTSAPVPPGFTQTTPAGI
jgi:hypothetical protein